MTNRDPRPLRHLKIVVSRRRQPVTRHLGRRMVTSREIGATIRGNIPAPVLRAAAMDRIARAIARIVRRSGVRQR
jgi:hypothetical protein